MTTRIGIFVFDGCEELDWAGPWEVLGAWAEQWPGDGVELFTVADDEGPITCAKGLRVLPDYVREEAPPMDVLIYPGGRGTRTHIGDSDVEGWVRRQAEGGVLMASVCTGSLVFASSGLLDGRPATTHWGSVDLLAELGNDIDVRPSERFVDDGDVITAAGVSAGIDMALHLISRLHSAGRAREVKHYIQYYPEPPV